MSDLQKAALFQQLNEMVEEIDMVFKEHGFDPEDFDEDALDSGDVADYDIASAYNHINRFKHIIEG